jgi:hypothetical protein
LDLHLLLPSDYTGEGAFSQAHGVDESGNIIGWARHIPSGANHAVLWAPVPEPSTVFLLGLSALYLVCNRKKQSA